MGFIIIIACCDDCEAELCYSLEVLGLKILIISLLFIGATFHYSRKWTKTDSIIYKVSRQPVMAVKYCVPETPTQVLGVIKSVDGKLIESHYAKEKCIFYHFIREKWVSNGDSSYWKIIQNISEHVPFKVIDKTGEILVTLRNVDSDFSGYQLPKQKKSLLDYSNSEVDAIKICYRKEYFKDWDKYRVSEYVLKEDMVAFVNGWVFEEKGKKVIGENSYTPLIISRKTKEDYLEDFAKGDNFFYESNFLLLVGSTILFLLLQYWLKIPIEFLAIPFLIVFARVIYTIFNRMIELKNRCSNADSQIFIELKKRNDLIPRLADIVRQYAKYGKNVVELVASLRTGEKESVSKQLEEYNSKQKATREIIAVIENYPELKANQVFLDFAGRMTTVEENISYFRGFYNKTVLKYNTLIQQIPFFAIAKIFRFKKMEFFKL